MIGVGSDKNTFSVFPSKGLEVESARRGKETALEIQIAVALWYLEGIVCDVDFLCNSNLFDIKIS